MKKLTRIGISVAALMLAGGTVMAVAGSDSQGCRGSGGMGYGGMGYGGMESGKGGPGMHQGGRGYGAQSGRPDPARMLEQLDKQLSLSDQQRQQVTELMARHQQQMPANRAQMEQFRAQMQGLDPAAVDYTDQVEKLAKQRSELMSQKMVQRAKHHAELYALLTPEQQQAFRQHKSQRGQQLGGHHRMW